MRPPIRHGHTIWTAGTVGALMLGLAGGVRSETPADRQLRFFEQRVKTDAEDFIAWNGLADLCLLRQRETGDDAWLTRAQQAVDASVKAVGLELNPGGLAQGARVDLASHRFARARDGARRLRELQPGRSGPLATLADALLELGDLDEAAKVIGELVDLEGQTVTAESRLARLAWLRGQPDEAHAHSAAALAAAQAAVPRSPIAAAWCALQLGELAFRTGRWDDAESAYRTAGEALPDWWSTLEHLAELEGARGHDAAAVALYERALAQAPRPELWQALGDFHAFMKRPDAAKPCHERALAGYQASVDRGEIRYVHHLAGFYSDSQENAVEAVTWARRDLEQRHGAAAWDALAWALYKQGDLPSALDAAKKVVATGIADSHLLYHAAMIHISSGEIAAGQALLKRSAEVNPHFNAFHAHR